MNQRRVPWENRVQSGDIVVFLLSGIALGVAIAGTDADALLRYRRGAVLDGEIWRLLTAHVVHLGLAHLVLNLTALFVLWAGFLRRTARSPGPLLLYLLASAIATGIGLLAFAPSLQWYVGLSGVLHGLAAAAAVETWRSQRRVALMLGALLIVKLAAEQLGSPATPLAAAIGGRVIVDAHLYGALGGLAAALPRLRRVEG